VTVTTYRRYSFLHPGKYPEGHEKVLATLQRACEHHWWYSDPHVEGKPYERLSFSFTVAGRDQWFAHKRALKLAVDCYYVLGMAERQVPEPDWESLAPHTNRGRWRVPTASAG
jgi:hypothetical protein